MPLRSPSCVVRQVSDATLDSRVDAITELPGAGVAPLFKVLS